MNRLAKRFTWLAIGALSLTGAAAYAGQITLYESSNFQGRYLTTTDSVSNLQRTDFNDTASSIVVTDGVWEACSSAYFHGRCVQLAPGSYSELRGNLDDRISSVRQVADSVAPFPRPESSGVSPRIVLYQHTGRGTKSVELNYSVHELDNIDFNNRADAAVVYGGVWRLCERERGRGPCTELTPGRYDTLGALNGRISSAELVASAQAPGPTGEALPLAIPPRSTGRLVLYEYPNFGGRWVTIERGRAPDLDWAHFYDRAGSMRVEAGTWLVCTEMGYQGQCRTVGPGEYPQLAGALGTGVASARQIYRPEYGAVSGAYYR